MRHLARLFALAALAAAFTSCGRCGGKPVPGKEAPRPVAIVNGEPIAREKLQRELVHVRSEGAEGSAPDHALKQQLLKDLIDRALLLQQARARSISVSEDLVDRSLLRLHAEYPGTHFDDLLAQQRLSQSELKEGLRAQLVIEKLFTSEVFPSITVADAEIEQYYTAHAQEFEAPEQVHALQVVVKTREEAGRLREELKRRPQAFADIARRASLAPEGRVGGDLGWFGKDSGMPEVFDLCFRLPLNTLSEVTPSPYGFHVFKVIGRHAPSRRPFAEVRTAIHDKLLREKRATAQESYLLALQHRSRIQIDQAALDALTP